jgi:mono/diheme cytochrome c family protein
MQRMTRAHGHLRACFGASLGWAFVAACGSPATPAPAPAPYLDDVAYRRAELEASIVDPQNAYSKLRLQHYASGTASDWDLLPEWNPPAEPIAAAELDAPGGASTSAFVSPPSPLSLPTRITSEDDPALVALGREAFARYPTQLASYAGVALGSRAAAARYGLWVDPARGVGGLVRARMADGSAATALTCSSCHSAPGAGAVEDGLPNAQLDIGAAILASPLSVTDPAAAAAISTWGPGRLDVTPLLTYPARIPDLRPVRWLTYLHQEGTLRQRDRTALAIRIETLIIASNGEVLRPPRIVALALAAYVASLANGLPPANAAAAAQTRGAQVFASTCSGCHTAPGFTGAPVALAAVGTDPLLGQSPDRGTGAYRVPSLHGVGTRGPLLHDGTVPSVAALFDPSRPTASFAQRLHGAGAVPGHLYGLNLADTDRAALIAYVEAL